MFEESLETIAWQLAQIVAFKTMFENFAIPYKLIFVCQELWVQRLGQLLTPHENKVNQFVTLDLLQLLAGLRIVATPMFYFLLNGAGSSLDQINHDVLVKEETLLLEDSLEKGEAEVRDDEFLHR